MIILKETLGKLSSLLVWVRRGTNVGFCDGDDEHPLSIRVTAELTCWMERKGET
jgi:hypothetical protein